MKIKINFNIVKVFKGLSEFELWMSWFIRKDSFIIGIQRNWIRTWVTYLLLILLLPFKFSMLMKFILLNPVTVSFHSFLCWSFNVYFMIIKNNKVIIFLVKCHLSNIRIQGTNKTYKVFWKMNLEITTKIIDW